MKKISVFGSPQYQRNKLFEVVENLLRRLAIMNIVPAAAEKNLPRLVGKDDPVGEVRAIQNLRTAEPAIDYFVVREILAPASSSV